MNNEQTESIEKPVPGTGHPEQMWNRKQGILNKEGTTGITHPVSGITIL